MIYLRFVLLQPRRDYYAIAATLDRCYLIDHLIPSLRNRIIIIIIYSFIVRFLTC